MPGRYGERHNGVTKFWDVERLWKLAEALPVIEVRLDSIDAVDQVTWFGSRNPRPTCREIIGHFKRIQNADLSYPILLSETGKVFDGMHRIAKAVANGDETISARQFTQNPEPDQIITESEGSEIERIEICGYKLTSDSYSESNEVVARLQCVDQNERHRLDLIFVNARLRSQDTEADQFKNQLTTEPYQVYFNSELLVQVQAALAQNLKPVVILCHDGTSQLEVFSRS